MSKFRWKETLNGYQSSVFNDKYLLDVWRDNNEWAAVVNRRKVADETGRTKTFSLAESAQAAAEELALEMMHKDGVIDSSGN